MRLINTEIKNYIRCIKTLWNDFYRFLPDGEHDFTDVKDLIWKTLVLKLLHDTIEDVSNGEIIAIPRTPSTSALIGIESQSERAISWQNSTTNYEGQQFLFEDFFDFRNWEDPRELQYVECWSITPLREHLLIPTDDVDFYYRARR
jgi:hypothetical protein